MKYRSMIKAFVCTALMPFSSYAQAPNSPAGPSDALVVSSAGFEAVFVDEKDQGMARAVRMLVEDRLLELPIELDAMFPAPAVQFAMQLLMEPWTLQAGLLPEFDPAAMNDDDLPPLYAQWSFEAADAAAAGELFGRFSAILAELAPIPTQPVEERPGWRVLLGPDVPIYFGMLEVDGRHAFAIAVNHIAPGSAALGDLDLPAGIAPALAMAFDSRHVQPLLEMLLEDDELAPVVAQLRAMGLLGEEPMVFTAAIGHGAPGEPSHMAMRYTNYRGVLQQTGMLPDVLLGETDLNRVPADATYAQVTKVNLQGFLEWMREIAEEDSLDGLFEEIEANTGIHPQRDVLDHLGQTAGVYMSESTGGGGLLSMAGYMQVTNAEALNDTIAQMTGAANQMAQMAVRGYVRFGDREIDGQRITTLMFPGLPVPLELSFAIADGYLYGAASPQGLLAAIAQGRGDLPGLTDNPRFSAVIGEDLGAAMQVTFYDIPRSLRPGYGTMSLAMAALANAARSPIDVQRDPGLITPSLADLSRDARAAGYVARFEGDDLVVRGTFDRSMLVLGTGTIGVMGGPQALAIPALVAGVTLPALGKARDQAQATRSMANLRTNMVALMTYGAEHNDRVPPSMQALIEQGYTEELMLQSPFGPAPDGRGDYFFNLNVELFSQSRYPDKHVLAYDRAMLASQWRTAVLFYDGHVQLMDAWQFDEIRQHRANADVDFELPWE